MYNSQMAQNALLTPQALRAAHAEMAQKMGAKIFLSLITNQSFPIAKMQSLSREFCCRMDRSFLGRNWAKKDKAVRLQGPFYVENEASNIHTHGLMTQPYGDLDSLQKAADDIWIAICPSGSVKIMDVGDIRRRSFYCTKEFFMPGFFERQFFMAAV